MLGYTVRRGSCSRTRGGLRRPFVPEWRKELGEGQAKRTRQLRDSRDANLTLTTFHTADIVAVQARPCPKLFLRDTPLLPQFTHPPADRDRKVQSHDRYRGELRSRGLHTIVCIRPAKGGEP